MTLTIGGILALVHALAQPQSCLQASHHIALKPLVQHTIG
jgi:hypothetical protein